MGTNGTLQTFMMAWADIVSVAAALLLAVAIRTHPAFEPMWTYFNFDQRGLFMEWRDLYTALFLFQSISHPLAFWAMGMYRVRPEETPVGTWLRAASVVTGAHFAFIALVYVLRAVTIPHGVVVANLILLLAIVPTWRMLLNARARRRLAQGKDLRNVLVVGNDRSAQDLATELVQDTMHGRRVVGFLTNELDFKLSYLRQDLLARADVWGPVKAGNGAANATSLAISSAGGKPNGSSAATPNDSAGHSNGNGHGNGANGGAFAIPTERGSAMVQTYSTGAAGATVQVTTAPALGLKSVVVENVRRQPRHLLAPVGTTSAEDIGLAIDGLCVEEIFVSPSVGMDAMVSVVRAARERGVDVHIIPQHFPELGATPAPWSVGPMTVMGLYSSPIGRPGKAVKRALDIIGGIFGLIAFAPILLFSFLAIKAENPRAPLLYWGRRVGLKGRHFRICKLSTMVPDADFKRDDLAKLNAREGPWFQVDEDKDPRITRIGRFLRKTTINEIPQFWNVIKGEMSLVGPRPLATDEVSRFVDYDFRYYRSFDVKPGMTGLWQVKARKDPSFDKRIQMDFEYIDNWSVWLDIKLLLQTPLALFTNPGR